MAVAPTVNKVISDIKDCVTELKTEFRDSRVPINDDCTILHRFNTKIEYVLQHGKREKWSILGTKKDYWDYFCHCLASYRHVHDGLKYVKTIPELRTSLGHGRAFIRFCLMHQCLADSLQQCFMNERITSDWYHEKALLRQPEQRLFLLTSLYELNDVQFDLCPRSYDLDASWPTFSRKLFGASYTWQPPSRTVSISSLISVTSQCESLTSPRSCSDIQASDTGDIDEIHFDEVDAAHCEFQQQIDEQKNEVEELYKLKEQQPMESADDRKQLEAHSHHFVEMLEDTKRKCVECEARDSFSSEENVRVNIQQSGLHQGDCREHITKHEQELLQRISQLELERDTLIKKVSFLENSFAIHATSDSECMIMDSKQDDGVQSDEETLNENKEDEVSSQSKLQMAHKIRDLMNQLVATEASLVQVTADKEDLNNKIDHMQCLNDSIKSLVEAVEQENSKLRRDNEMLQTTSKKCYQQIENLQSTNSLLESKVSELESKNACSSQIVDESSVYICNSESSPIIGEDKNSFNILKELSIMIDDLESEMEEGVEKDANSLSQNFNALKEKLRFLEANLNHNSSVLMQKESAQQQDESSVLQTLLSQQKSLVDEFQQKLEVLLQQNHSLNSQLCLLREILYPQQKIPNTAKFKHKSGNRTKSPGVDDDMSRDSGNESSAPSSRRGRESVDSSEESVAFNLSNLSDNSLSSVIYFIKCISNKLQILMGKVENINSELGSSCDLNANLISRVQEQVRTLTGITQELQNAQNLLSGLKKEHSKLQTAESIMKYELQEKRKLLNRLRKQLESTREEWNRVRLKNSESEAEWQNLREEFAKRHKQASEESGFVDDTKTSDNQNSDSKEKDSTVPVDMDSPLESDSLVLSMSPDCKGAEGMASDGSTSEQHQKSRLEILEEQCHSFYVSLLQNAKKSTVLEERLEAILSGSNKYSSTNDMLHGNGDDDSKTCASKSGQESEDETTGDIPLYRDDESDSELPHEVDGAGYSEFEISPFCKENSFSGTKISNEILNCSSFHDENDFELLQSNLDLTDINSNRDNTLENQSVISIPDELDHHSDSNDSDIESIQTVDQIQAEDLMQSSIRRQVLGNVVERLKNERITHQTQETELKAQVEQLQRTKSSLEQQLSTLQDERSTSSNKEVDFKKRAEFIFRKEREQFSNKLLEYKNQNSVLEAKIIKLEEELKHAQLQVTELENELKEVKKELDLVKTTKDQEITALQFHLSSEVLKFERALRQYSEQDTGLADMRKRVTEQEQQIHTLEEALDEIKDEREVENKQQWHELDEIRTALSTRDEECATLNEDLKKALMELDEGKKTVAALSAQLEETKAANEESIAVRDSELNQLRGDIKELTKKLIKLIKEKDILWKRTDQLSHLQRVQAADRWMDDREVTRCLGCRIHFSFTVRKHHCRLCGRIFCRDCANNWLLTTASSRQSRVCNECFIQHVKFESETSSSVPTVAEDSEDEDVPISSDQSLSDTRIDKAVSAISVSDSISVASLPAPGVTHSLSLSTPFQYGSAPELNSPRFCSSADESSLMSTGHQAFLSASENLATVSRNIISHHDFDVISDEEIARSLSASSPYSSFCEDNQLESRLLLTITRTTEELEKTGGEGEIWVNAGMKYGVPILCYETSLTLHWKFSSEPKSISFGVEYRQNDKTPLEVLRPSVRVKSHIQCVEGKLIMKKPGVYILVFDNTFSRVMAKKIRYFLHVDRSSTENT